MIKDALYWNHLVTPRVSMVPVLLEAGFVNISPLSLYSVCRIRINKFLGIPDPDPLVRESESGSSHHQAKIVRKPLISTVLRLLYDFLSVKNDVNVLSNSIKQTKLFLVLRSQQNPDPDPLVRCTDPRIRIRTNMSRIWNTIYIYPHWTSGTAISLRQHGQSYLPFSLRTFPLLSLWYYIPQHEYGKGIWAAGGEMARYIVCLVSA